MPEREAEGAAQGQSDRDLARLTNLQRQLSNSDLALYVGGKYLDQVLTCGKVRDLNFNVCLGVCNDDLPIEANFNDCKCRGSVNPSKHMQVVANFDVFANCRRNKRNRWGNCACRRVS